MPKLTSEIGIITNGAVGRFHQQHAQKAIALFRDRPQPLMSCGAVLARDQAQLDELSSRLAQQVENRRSLTAEIEKGQASSTAKALEQLAPIANSALAVVPALEALQKHLSALPQPVASALYDSCAKIKLN